jgi:hypothetical protein
MLVLLVIYCISFGLVCVKPSSLLLDVCIAHNLDKLYTYSGLSLAAFIAPANILFAPSFGRLPRSLSILGLLESADPSRPIGTADISMNHHEVGDIPS